MASQVMMKRVEAKELAEWFGSHAASLVLYARNWVDRAVAEDVVQEAFVRLAGTATRPDNVRAWLLACVRNAALDSLRGNRRRLARDKKAGEERWFAQSATRHRDVLDAADLQRALAALAPSEREIIVLRIWNAATFEEIAAIVELPLSTVYARYQSGLKTMRARWEEPCPKK